MPSSLIFSDEVFLDRLGIEQRLRLLEEEGLVRGAAALRDEEELVLVALGRRRDRSGRAGSSPCSSPRTCSAVRAGCIGDWSRCRSGRSRARGPLRRAPVTQTSWPFLPTTMAVPVSWQEGRIMPAEMLAFFISSSATKRSLSEASGSSRIFAQLCQMARAEEMRDVADRVGGQPRECSGLDLQDRASVELDRRDTLVAELSVLGLVRAQLEHLLELKIGHRVGLLACFAAPGTCLLPAVATPPGFGARSVAEARPERRPCASEHSDSGSGRPSSVPGPVSMLSSGPSVTDWEKRAGDGHEPDASCGPLYHGSNDDHEPLPLRRIPNPVPAPIRGGQEARSKSRAMPRRDWIRPRLRRRALASRGGAGLRRARAHLRSQL